MRSIVLVFVFGAALLIRPGAARSIEATLDAYYWSYEEFVADDPDFVDEVSDPVFVSLGLRNWRTWPDAFRVLFTAEASLGEVAYNGSGTLDKDYYKFRGEVYGAYRIGDFAPFIGIGYRWLYDDGGGQLTSTGFSSYDRQSQYVYVPIGGIYRITDDLRIKGQYNLLLYGIQTSFLSDVAGFSDIENDQNFGWGTDITIDYRLSARFGVYTFFRYWDIDDSDPELGTINGVIAFQAFEPHNQTIEAGFGVSYKF